MNIETAVGTELRVCRQKKRISQEQLGFDAGIHRTYVSLIERGVKSPTLGVLFRLCQALDVPRAQPAEPGRRLTCCESGGSIVRECRGQAPVAGVVNTKNRWLSPLCPAG